MTIQDHVVDIGDTQVHISMNDDRVSHRAAQAALDVLQGEWGLDKTNTIREVLIREAQTLFINENTHVDHTPESLETPEYALGYLVEEWEVSNAEACRESLRRVAAVEVEA